MQSINLNDGYESFAINGDESRVIRFNPSDPNLIQRYYQAMEDMKAAQEAMNKDVTLNADGTIMQDSDVDAAAAAQALKKVDDIVRDSVNMMFNSDVYDIVFAGQSPFCIVGRGEFLFEAFMNAIRPILEKSIKKAAASSKKRMDKYLKGYKR